VKKVALLLLASASLLSTDVAADCVEEDERRAIG
jgi:hypothetical protein